MYNFCRVGELCLVLALLLAPATQVGAQSWRKDTNELTVINQKLHGRVIDYTANHGHDNRIWSRSLYQRRDVYVYVPPGFDPKVRYPLLIWMHGFAQDEQSFLHFVAPEIDAAISCGKLPPFLAVAPDGSFDGEPASGHAGSFFLNTQAGAFEDFVLQDVWDFMCQHYPLRSERDAHILGGTSMGAFAAFNYGIKHRNAFGVVLGLFPPLNLRWVDDQGRYFSEFDPRHWGWRTDLEHGREVIGKFYGGLQKINLRTLLEPLYGSGPAALQELMQENPIEMIDRYHLREGELAMYVAFAGQDEFNIHTQVESFLYLCKCRGLTVQVGYDPDGHHDLHTARRLTPGIFDWLGPKLAPYSPALGQGCSVSPPLPPESPPRPPVALPSWR